MTPTAEPAGTAVGSAPTLWLVATPIGNLSDLAPRAIEILGQVALVACEDTRRTRKLLHHAGIQPRRLAVANEHTEYALVEDVLAVLASGNDVAVVSDAGTPGISDPGHRLVAGAIQAGFEVSAVPGPSAAIMAVTISGLPSDRFVMEGFLPRKASLRAERIERLIAEPRTVVLFEAPHRIERTRAELVDALGPDRPVALCRELTKRFETVSRGTLGSINIGQPRGEYVLVLGANPTPARTIDDDAILAALTTCLDNGRSRKDAVSEVVAELGAPKNRVYALLHRQRPSSS